MKNQTPLEALNLTHDSALGTGIFLHESGKSLVKDIIYDKCVTTGEDALAFKWVPNIIVKFEELNSCSI